MDREKQERVGEGNMLRRREERGKDKIKISRDHVPYREKLTVLSLGIGTFSVCRHADTRESGFL